MGLALPDAARNRICGLQQTKDQTDEFSKHTFKHRSLNLLTTCVAGLLKLYLGVQLCLKSAMRRTDAGGLKVEHCRFCV